MQQHRVWASFAWHKRLTGFRSHARAALFDQHRPAASLAPLFQLLRSLVIGAAIHDSGQAIRPRRALVAERKADGHRVIGRVAWAWAMAAWVKLNGLNQRWRWPFAVLLQTYPEALAAQAVRHSSAGYTDFSPFQIPWVALRGA